MDQFPQMVYRQPGNEPMHGGFFSTRIVADAGELAAALADGWHETTTAACAPVVVPAVADNAPPTRAELEAKAVELGIKVDGRMGDKKLGELIAEKLKA